MIALIAKRAEIILTAVSPAYSANVIWTPKQRLHSDSPALNRPPINRS